jgi:16S rRNA processing protein RimM
MDNPSRIVLGRINGFLGLKGWLKIFSNTRPRDNIFQYTSWWIGEQCFELERGQQQGKGLVVKLKGIDNREQAAILIKNDILVERQALPEIEEDEYYWHDLVGLSVRTVEGVSLGVVSHLFETGANDVLVVRETDGDKRERLLPWVFDETIIRVDRQQNLIEVNWDPDF